MIEAEGLTFRAGARDLVTNVSASFEPGQVHLVIGPNGAGKSTLIKMLARLLRPAAGRIHYDGVDIAGESEGALARRRAVLSQAVEIAFPLTVREVVMMGRYPHFGTHPARHDEGVVDEVMRYFDVVEMAGRSYPTLSGGEKQRVNFARVLAQVWEPIEGRHRVLFLDEPLTFLDIGHQLGFMRKLREAVAGGDMIIVGVVHDLNLAARFADRLMLLDSGRLVASGSSEQVLTPEHVQAAFGVKPVVATAEGTTGRHLIFE
jgi:iron complex transport system ATP-binding protein